MSGDMTILLGLAVGYAFIFNFYACMEMSVQKAASIEKSFPFKRFSEEEYFINASDMGGAGTILNFGGSFLSRGMGGR